MLNIYGLDQQQVVNELLKNKILAAVHNNQIIIMNGKVEQAQSVIGRMYYSMPNLLPTQFYFLLAKSGLDTAIDALLTSLQSEDLDKYATYKAYLNGARFYEFDKAIAMLTQAGPIIAQAYPGLDLSIPTLKSLWLQAAKF
jgi:hypothetical protein